MRKRSVTVALAVTALVWVAAPAWAHVEVSPGEAAAGGATELEFEVGHGCDGSPVVAVSIRMPGGVTDISPQDREGWTYSVENVDGLDVVTWEGGPQGANEHGSFFMDVTLPDAEGEVLAFPAVQICEEGEVAWIELPAADGSEPASPAPLLVLTAAATSSTEGSSPDTTQGDHGDGEGDHGDGTSDTTDVTTETSATTPPETTVTAVAPEPVTTVVAIDTTVAVASEESGPGGTVALVAVGGGLLALGGVLAARRRRPGV